MKNANRAARGLMALALFVLLSFSLTAMAGTGPDDASAPTDSYVSVNPGDRHWYAFYYAGDGSQINIRLEVVPEEGANFEIWTPEDIRDWGAGVEVVPVGRGSPDPAADGRLVWAGSFNIEGTYYIIVEHTGSAPGASYYLLQVSGDGVSASAPAARATPEREPAKRGAKAAAPSAPKGRLAFQTTYGGAFYTINADGTNLQRITDGIDATWSPNGQEIAFTRWREPRGVWVVNLTTGHEWRVLDWDRARWPSWSPDGAEILFSRMTGTGRQEETEFCFRGFCFTFPAHPHWRLGLVRTDGTDFREPPSSEISHAPMWSPDGTKVIYDDVQGLRVQTLDGEVSYLITNDPKDTSPAWSPDGEAVAFVRRQHDHWEIYAVDADGRNPRRLTNTPRKPGGGLGNSVAPAWSPDGNYIAFLTDRSGKWDIWVMRANGTQAKAMFPRALDGLTLDYGYVSERAISWTE